MKNHSKTITLTTITIKNPYKSSLTGVYTLDYESKGRGFESRRAHTRKTLENQRSQGFLLFVHNAVLGCFRQ